MLVCFQLQHIDVSIQRCLFFIKPPIAFHLTLPLNAEKCLAEATPCASQQNLTWSNVMFSTTVRPNAVRNPCRSVLNMFHWTGGMLPAAGQPFLDPGYTGRLPHKPPQETDAVQGLMNAIQVERPARGAGQRCLACILLSRTCMHRRCYAFWLCLILS